MRVWLKVSLIISSLLLPPTVLSTPLLSYDTMLQQYLALFRSILCTTFVKAPSSFSEFKSLQISSFSHVCMYVCIYMCVRVCVVCLCDKLSWHRMSCLTGWMMSPSTSSNAYLTSYHTTQEPSISPKYVYVRLISNSSILIGISRHGQDGKE